jgi:hypothetical protein
MGYTDKTLVVDDNGDPVDFSKETGGNLDTIKTHLSEIEDAIEEIEKCLESVGTDRLLIQLYDGTTKLPIAVHNAVTVNTQGLVAYGVDQTGSPDCTRAIPVYAWSQAISGMDRVLPVRNMTVERVEGTKITDGVDVADIETLESVSAPNLDGKNALVTMGVVFGTQSSSVVTPVRSVNQASLGQDLDNYIGLSTASQIYGRVDDNTVKAIKIDSDNILLTKPTDGTDTILFDDDDDSIAKGQTAQVVIVLNYVRNAEDTAWVPMTQP